MESDGGEVWEVGREILAQGAREMRTLANAAGRLRLDLGREAGCDLKNIRSRSSTEMRTLANADGRAEMRML